MAKTEKCRVCGGDGPTYRHIEGCMCGRMAQIATCPICRGGSTLGTGCISCFGCDGRGWITVHEPIFEIRDPEADLARLPRGWESS